MIKEEQRSKVKQTEETVGIMVRKYDEGNIVWIEWYVSVYTLIL